MASCFSLVPFQAGLHPVARGSQCTGSCCPSALSPPWLPTHSGSWWPYDIRAPLPRWSPGIQAQYVSGTQRQREGKSQSYVCTCTSMTSFLLCLPARLALNIAAPGPLLQLLPSPESFFPPILAWHAPSSLFLKSLLTGPLRIAAPA